MLEGADLRKNRPGLTAEEREGLSVQPEGETGMDFRASLLAFVCLLLICLLIAVTSVIARFIEERESKGLGSASGKESTENVLPHKKSNTPDSNQKRPESP